MQQNKPVLYPSNDNNTSSTLLFLCGDVDSPLDEFSSIVTWCPIRYHELKRNGIQNYLFGDFSPGAKQGEILDCVLHQRLDDCLHKEMETNPLMKFVPLSIQQIKWPLSRYFWLKECVRKIFQTFQPKRCVISSQEDDDIVCAVKTVAEEFQIHVEVRIGIFDGTSSTLYREAPYGLPLKLDFLWLFKFHWKLIGILRPRISVLLESYPNIKNAYMPRFVYVLNLERALAIFRMVYKKLLRILRISSAGVVVRMEPIIKNKKMVINCASIWVMFSKDEQEIINGAIVQFFSHYSPSFLEDISGRIAYIFSTIKLTRLIISIDQLDAGRLLTYIAKKCGVQVDYLPHGVLYEDYSGMHRDSLFYPDRVLAWNEDSRNALRHLGWDSVNIKHPVNQHVVVPLKRPPNNYRLWQVLVLIPDWGIVSQGGREDCAITDLIEVYNGLTEIGIPGLHIHVKYHGISGIKKAQEAKEIHLKRLQQLLDMRFFILNSSLRMGDVVVNYDLVIVGVTTGIFEVVLRGVPVVLFGDGFNRVGALERYPLPRARTGKELQESVQAYHTSSVDEVYTHLAQSLQAGSSISYV